MTTSENTPRRDTGGAFPPFNFRKGTRANFRDPNQQPAAGYDIKWSVDPGPKYNLATPGPDPAPYPAAVSKAIRTAATNALGFPGVAGHTEAIHRVTATPTHWTDTGESWWIANCTGCSWTHQDTSKAAAQAAGRGHENLMTAQKMIQPPAAPEPIIGTIELDIIPTLDKFPKPTPRAETPTFPAHDTHRIDWHDLPGGEYRVQCRCGFSATQTTVLAANIAIKNHHQDVKPNPTEEPPMKDQQHIVNFDTNPGGGFTAQCGGCDWNANHDKLSALSTIAKQHTHWARKDNAWGTPEPEAAPAPKPATSADRDNYTIVEVVEELPDGVHPEDRDLVKYNRILVNGSPVRIAQDGILIDYGDDAEPGPPGRVVRVNLELLIDEFRIRRVPAGHIDRS